MTTTTTTADLQKKITAKRAAVTAAREAHAAAAAAHEAARERAAAAVAAMPEAKPGQIRYLTPEAIAARAEADAAHEARKRAAKLVTRREIALARLLDIAAAARDAARRAEAATPEAAAPAPSGVDLQLLVNADWNARCEVQSAARRVEIACREQGMGSPGHRHALTEQESAVKRAADIAARLAAARLRMA